MTEKKTNTSKISLYDFAEKYLTEDQIKYLRCEKDFDGNLFKSDDINDRVTFPVATKEEHDTFIWFCNVLRNKTKNGNKVLEFMGYKEFDDGVYNVYVLLNKPYCIKTKDNIINEELHKESQTLEQ